MEIGWERREDDGKPNPKNTFQIGVMRSRVCLAAMRSGGRSLGRKIAPPRIAAKHEFLSR